MVNTFRTIRGQTDAAQTAFDNRFADLLPTLAAISRQQEIDKENKEIRDLQKRKFESDLRRDENADKLVADRTAASERLISDLAKAQQAAELAAQGQQQIGQIGGAAQAATGGSPVGIDEASLLAEEQFLGQANNQLQDTTGDVPPVDLFAQLASTSDALKGVQTRPEEEQLADLFLQDKGGLERLETVKRVQSGGSLIKPEASVIKKVGDDLVSIDPVTTKATKIFSGNKQPSGVKVERFNPATGRNDIFFVDPKTGKDIGDGPVGSKTIPNKNFRLVKKGDSFVFEQGESSGDIDLKQDGLTIAETKIVDKINSIQAGITNANTILDIIDRSPELFGPTGLAQGVINFTVATADNVGKFFGGKEDGEKFSHMAAESIRGLKREDFTFHKDVSNKTRREFSALVESTFNRDLPLLDYLSIVLVYQKAKALDESGRLSNQDIELMSRAMHGTGIGATAIGAQEVVMKILDELQINRHDQETKLGASDKGRAFLEFKAKRDAEFQKKREARPPRPGARNKKVSKPKENSLTFVRGPDGKLVPQ